MAPGVDVAKPSRSASSRATVLLPAPAGPSMATIIGLTASELEHLEEPGEAYCDALGVFDLDALA